MKDSSSAGFAVCHCSGALRMSCIPGEGPAKGMHQGKGRNILAQQGNKHMDSHLLSDNEVTLHACPEANSSLPFCLLTKKRLADLLCKSFSIVDGGPRQSALRSLSCEPQPCPTHPPGNWGSIPCQPFYSL